MGIPCMYVQLYMHGGRKRRVDRDVLFMTRTKFIDVLYALYMSQCFDDHGRTYMYTYTAHGKFKQENLSTLDLMVEAPIDLWSCPFKNTNSTPVP